jgi:hypothetical protein
MGLAIYLLAISKTIHLYQQNQTLTHELAEAKESPRLIHSLKEQLAPYKNVWNVSNDTLLREARLLEAVANSCRQQGVLLVSFPLAVAAENESRRSLVRTVRIRGEFKRLLQVIYQLERQHTLGTVISTRFVLEEDRQQNISYLYAYLYLQTFSAKP